MNRYLRPVALGITCFALGAAVTRYYDTHRLIAPPVVDTAKSPADAGSRAGDDTSLDVAAINFEREPLWAYGFDRPPAPGEKALPQNPPTRNLRPDEDQWSRPGSGGYRAARGYIRSWTSATVRT